MKEVYIKNIDLYQGESDKGKAHFSGKNLEVSDGYHTFDELYDHRITLFIQLCRFIKTIEFVKGEKVVMIERKVWRSKLHSDGSEFKGWFIMGIDKEPGRQLTYHIPLERWEETNFAETLDKAPEFDGHSSKEVLERLKTL